MPSLTPRQHLCAHVTRLLFEYASPLLRSANYYFSCIFSVLFGLFLLSESLHHLSFFSFSFTEIVLSSCTPSDMVGFPHSRTKFPPSHCDVVACFLVWKDLQWPFRALLTRRLCRECLR